MFYPNCHHQVNISVAQSKFWEQQQQEHVAHGETPMQMFSYSFGSWWAFLTKQEQINTLYDSRHNSKLGKNDTKIQRGRSKKRETEWERERKRRGGGVERLSLIFHSASKWECGLGVDLWPETISLHLSIFCLPMADKIDRIHRYFMMQKVSCY